MIKVLQIGMSHTMGGIEKFILNHYQKINPESYTFDFLSWFPEIAGEKEIQAHGGKIYVTENVKEKPLSSCMQIRSVIEQNQYDVVHIHFASFANPVPLMAVVKSPCQKIILHAHNNGMSAGCMKSICHHINRLLSSKMKVQRLACSKSAGKWMFGNVPFTVLENAIPMQHFQYNEQERIAIRNLLGIEENGFVIGNVGRLVPQKNQKFLIETFAEYVKINPDAYLMIVGEGYLKNQLQALAYKLNIESKVIFTGFCNNVSPYYQAMDVFCLPSLYEGLGIVGIEAQASGLPSLFSKNCVQEVDISKQSAFLPIENKDTWIHEIHMHYLSRTLQTRNKEITQYDIEENVKKLEKIYESVI